MESRISIDIDSQGNPVILIDYKSKDGDFRRPDVRDRLVGRFLDELYKKSRDEVAEMKVILRKGHVHENGMVAYVCLADLEVQEEQPLSHEAQHEALKAADHWAVENMPPDLYKKWKDELFYKGKSN